MIKIIPGDSFDFGMPMASLVEAHMRGIDKGWMTKRAAVLTREIQDLRPRPGHSYIHLISMGAQEQYGCFALGTLVKMSDGTFKRIENIEIGDLVATHLWRPGKVISLYARQYTGRSLKITAGASTLHCTEDHPFLQVFTLDEGGCVNPDAPITVKARDLKVGDDLSAPGESCGYRRVTAVVECHDTIVVRNLEIEGDHTYIVGDGIATRNCNRNGDGFNIKAADYELPDPKSGVPKLMRLHGGLEKYHATFKKHAHVFKFHQNKDPLKAIGKVAAEAVNPEMARGELLIEVPHGREWDKDRKSVV